MRKIRTPRDAKGPQALKTRPTILGDVVNQRVPPRTTHNVRHGHLVKGIRDINRIGWEPWEQVVAETMRMVDRQRFDRANSFYNAMARIQTLLADVRRREEELQATNEELEASYEEQQAANEELQATNEELQATTEELERTSAYRQTLMDSMLDVLMTTDKDGIITDVNRATEQISGYGREELVGQPFSRFFTDRDRAQAGIEQVIQEGDVSDYDLTMVTKDGRQVPVSYNAIVLHDPGGRITGVLGSARDITERKRAEEELKTLNESLVRSNAELEQFAYVASHDLQEPLRKIQAFGGRLKAKYGEALTDEGSDYIERMQNAAKRMQTLINDLLTFSRVTSKAEPFVEVDLAELVQEVVADLEVRIKRTGGRVEVGDLPIIEADPTQIRQLLQNLIDNGLKFSKKEEPPVVKVHGELLNGRCQIFVKDNGIGFDEKYLDRIFTVFQRLHARLEYEGTGIGLAVCRKIVERHGGNITARSTPGQGSTFIVTLPVKQSKGGNGQ